MTTDSAQPRRGEAGATPSVSLEGRPRSLYRYHPASRMAVLHNEGPLSLEVLEESMRQLFDEAASAGTQRILSDRRAMVGEYPEVGRERFMAFIESRPLELGPLHWAVVVRAEERALRLAPTASELSQSARFRVRVFTDMVEAIRWLLGDYDNKQAAVLLRWINEREMTPPP